MTNPHPPYLKCDVEEQSEKLNRTIDDNTLAWWSRQSKDIQEEAFGDLDLCCNGSNLASN